MTDRERAAASGRSPAPTMSMLRKIVYATGDHTVNLSLSALSLILLFFLTEVAGLRPVLAGAVVWIARLVDAISDPLMGRLSDRTPWKAGRRRPYFLIGALPFGICFSLLWATPFTGQASMFSYYLAAYVGLCLSMTVLSVPYMALIPEMARSYDERTSLNTFRAGASVLGTLVAAGMGELAARLGGGPSGYYQAGAIISFWLVAPWIGVFRVSWEDPPELRPQPSPVPGDTFRALRAAVHQPAFRRLCTLFVSARIAVDILGLSFAFFFTYVLGRESDWRPALVAMLCVVIFSLPVWLRIARRVDKHVLFIVGCAWWAALLGVLHQLSPDTPRWMVFGLCGLVGLGYAVADLMPWAMVGEVIDADRLDSGERREGIYNGLFTFLRKLGGATAFFLAGLVLELSGYQKNAIQPESTLTAIRALATLVPAVFLAIAIVRAVGYPLTRRRHTEILEALAAREAAGNR